MFDKNADETISWISEKEAEISTDELGQDLETIQSLLERQQGFQRDLAAIQQQVISLLKSLFMNFKGGGCGKGSNGAERVVPRRCSSH